MFRCPSPNHEMLFRIVIKKKKCHKKLLHKMFYIFEFLRTLLSRLTCSNVVYMLVVFYTLFPPLILIAQHQFTSLSFPPVLNKVRERNNTVSMRIIPYSFFFFKLWLLIMMVCVRFSSATPPETFFFFH